MTKRVYHPRRKDANHQAILAAFRALGCTVLDISDLPCGADAVVGRSGISNVIEIKDGSKPPSARKLTDSEKTMRETWKGGFWVISDLGDVQACVRHLTRVWARA